MRSGHPGGHDQPAAVAGGPLAVIDETVPFVAAGVCYSVVSAVLLVDEPKALGELDGVTGDRKRPWHSNKEGPEVRARMLAAMGRIGVVGRAVIVQCGRRSQETARSVALAHTVGLLVAGGVGQLVIETRSEAQDGRDEAVILDVLRQRHQPGAVTYSWEAKTHRVLWIADAIGGAVHEYLTGIDSAWYDQVAEATSLEVEYLTFPQR
jgi:hypothetical protein